MPNISSSKTCRLRMTKSGCPQRFHKKFPGHFQDKMKKFQDKTTKSSPALTLQFNICQVNSHNCHTHILH